VSLNVIHKGYTHPKVFKPLKVVFIQRVLAYVIRGGPAQQLGPQSQRELRNQAQTEVFVVCFRVAATGE
jgi:hypothetical protein